MRSRKLIVFLMLSVGVIFIVLSIVFLIKGYFLLQNKTRYETLKLRLVSDNSYYNSNRLKLNYIDNGEISHVIVKYDGNEITMKNESVIDLSSELDGSSYELQILVYYSDGKMEVLEKKYEVYKECAGEVQETFENLSNCDGNVSKYSVKKTVNDSMTRNVCSTIVEERMCSNYSPEISDNSTTVSSNGVANSSNEDSANKPKDEINNGGNKGCNLIVDKGTLGLNDWYISDVTLRLDISGSGVSSYGITSSTSVNYNKKKKLVVEKNLKNGIYYGYVKYEDGTKISCSVSLNIDKEKPTIPTSEIRKGSSDGSITKKSDSYVNYKLWWGNFQAKDKISGIDHYEYSTNCTGKKTNILNSSYLYPLHNKDSYNGTYCIRSVDKAGNSSDWTSGYSFKIDLIKPTCSVTISSGNSSDTINVQASDTVSGIVGYSYDGVSYSTAKTYIISKGKKVNVYVKDKAGNIGECYNYKKALILVGDSRTYWIQYHLGNKRILKTYENIYAIETGGPKEVYAVAKSGATIFWLRGYESATKVHQSGAYQVQYLLENLSAKKIYYDVIIASNLGVNDLNTYDAAKAYNEYVSVYNNLINSSQDVLINGVTKKASWKKFDNIISTDFVFISVNPIDESLINVKTPSNKRTNTIINSFNRLMYSKYGNNYLNSNSQFSSWFAEAQSAGQTRYDVRTCVTATGEKYNCEDGLHYSSYMNKNYIYPFYKSMLLG